MIARIGGDEFALLTSLPAEQIAALQARTNRTLAAENLSATFGVTFCPDDGQTACELFHKADDRLFAAKLVRRTARPSSRSRPHGANSSAHRRRH